MTASSTRSQHAFSNNLLELQKFGILQTRMYRPKWSAGITCSWITSVPVHHAREGTWRGLIDPERRTWRVMTSNGLPQTTVSDSSSSILEKIQVVRAF
jgi:hypothetical protein